MDAPLQVRSIGTVPLFVAPARPRPVWIGLYRPPDNGLQNWLENPMAWGPPSKNISRWQGAIVNLVDSAVFLLNSIFRGGQAGRAACVGDARSGARAYKVLRGIG